VVRPAFHVAQLNIALPREPLDTPLLTEFVEQLDPVNATADRAPGFVWRLQTEEGNATDIRAFGDDRLIINMSVWESLDALRAFVYTSRAHLHVLRRRREWFERLQASYLVLWWIPAGRVPTVEEAEQRLELLRALGPSPSAFTFRRHFPAPHAAPDAGDPSVTEDDRWPCPAG
jgi:uncharacterized protein DUF3291